MKGASNDFLETSRLMLPRWVAGDGSLGPPSTLGFPFFASGRSGKR